MAEIAAELGVTESRVSQIRAEALVLLRDAMNPELDPELVDARTPAPAAARPGAARPTSPRSPPGTPPRVRPPVGAACARETAWRLTTDAPGPRRSSQRKFCRRIRPEFPQAAAGGPIEYADGAHGRAPAR